MPERTADVPAAVPAAASVPAWGAPRTWALLGLLAGLYFAMAQVGLLFALSDSVASPIWPPAGLAVAAAIVWGRRALPAVFLGALAVELSADVPVVWSLAMALGNTLEAAVASAIVRRYGGREALQHLGGVLAVAVASFAGPLFAATFGAGSLIGADIVAWADAGAICLTWFLGDVAGILLVAPPLLLAPRLAQLKALRGRRLGLARVGEAAAVTLAFAGATLAVFVLSDAPMAFLAVPPLVWIAVRFGPAPTSLALLALDVVATMMTGRGHGPFAAASGNAAFLMLQAFALTASLLGLAVAAVAADRRAFSGQLEQRVAERTAGLREAQRAARMGTWHWQLASDRVEWSEELYRIYGLSPEHHKPTYEDYVARVHPDDRARVQAAMERAVREQVPYSHAERVRTGDGGWIHLHTWGRPLLDAEGHLIGLTGACQDVTEEVRLEAERVASAHKLAESLERFRALADASPIGIAHTSPAGSVDYANETWTRITGIRDFRDDDLVRRSIHPDDQPRSWALWGEAFRTGQPFQDDMRWVHPDGSVRYTNCRAVPTRGPDGAISGFVSTVEDITDRRAAEDARMQEQEARLEVRRLREQADFKTNFLRTAAHELGTPLTPLKIQLRVLRDLVARRPDPEEAKAVAILERNVDRLQVLVRDLLESARLQSGRLRLNPRPMDLAHVVHDVVETFQEPAIQTGVALDAAVPTAMAMTGDPDRVTQVLYNLLSNAMKFTPAGGKVHVQAEDLGDLVRFVVQDDGAGFTAEQASHLFQPFSQVHDPMQTSKPGSGLGLYICKGIVEQHGGAISAYSAGPGRGATFTVSLPRVARVPPPPVTPFDAKLEARKAT